MNSPPDSLQITLNEKSMPGYFISAPWRSSGKTILTVGIAAAARQHGLSVQTFKKGPDYIDPMWLGKASNKPCYNLDPYIQGSDAMVATFRQYALPGSLALVEGTMGLHDGLAGDGSDSNAAVSCKLGTPVILVADCRGMHRTVAALIKGLQSFDPLVQFAGLVLNRIRSARHEDKIRSAIEQHTDIALLGAVPETTDLQIDERELGLIPAAQTTDAGMLINRAAALVNSHCDLHEIFAAVQSSPASNRTCSTRSSVAVDTFTIGIARDEAFNFYYEDDLAALRANGATLVEISPLRDSFPDHLDGLLIGGGFPERYAAELAANQAFRYGLKAAVDAGLCIKAECAGLMYLCRSIELGNCSYPMVGAIAGDVRLCKQPQGRGYVQLKSRHSGHLCPGHEFHHSKIDFDQQPSFEYNVERGFGVDGEHDGIRINNTIATYAHFRHTRATPWVDWFSSPNCQTKIS